MKAKKKEKQENGAVQVRVSMEKFAEVCRGAISKACIDGLEKGWTPVQICDFELRLWIAANIIGNRLFGIQPRVDFSNGRMEKVKGEIEAGIWNVKEREGGVNEDQGQN